LKLRACTKVKIIIPLTKKEADHLNAIADDFSINIAEALREALNLTIEDLTRKSSQKA